MIEASGLVRRFGALAAVDGISLRVPDGTILALLGPNGAGKTTTVRMLAGLLAPTAGSAFVAGIDIRLEPAVVRGRVGLVTDTPGLYEQMKLGEYLDFFGSIYGMPREYRQHRIDELLELFNLKANRRDRMAGFSKGMKQKVALARALLHEPAALFLDEPTSGLDPLSARAVRELILELKNASRSIILCTHDLDEAERLADQVAIVRQGKIVACDAPAALRASGSGETTVRVELAAPCPDAVRVLQALDGVREPRHVSTTLIEYKASRPAVVNPYVVERLVASRAQIIAVTCFTRSLEDVYVDTISSDEQTGAGASMARDAATVAGG
ncbi:MAG: transporter related [Chloroflexi bacterium]|nr:transporter related [Chloroflexota bacterium]